MSSRRGSRCNPATSLGRIRRLLDLGAMLDPNRMQGFEPNCMHVRARQITVVAGQKHVANFAGPYISKRECLGNQRLQRPLRDADAYLQDTAPCIFSFTIAATQNVANFAQVN